MSTMIEHIISSHSDRTVRAGDIVDVWIDARVARDFGGANVVKNLRASGLRVADPSRTFFTFDCNPGGSDQGYAANQQLCRVFARENGIRVFDVDAGIGTHIAIDEGLVGPGGTLVSTDSHANILGAIGAFGQGMGDQDIAHVFARGYVWFKVPQTIRIELKGRPHPSATPKDVTLALIKHFGANGLLGYAAEVYGPYVEELDVAGRVTLASMGTEAGSIILLFPPSRKVLEQCAEAAGQPVTGVYADADAKYADVVHIDIEGLEPLLARPGHPEDVVPVREVAGRRIDSVFIGSCTNGRFEDLRAAARVLEGRRVAPNVILKVVPATDAVWRQALEHGLIRIFKDAGALVSHAGCAGCAAGQVGQNGPGEVTVSTGNRNFPGKQGQGEVYLASPETAAACAVAGVIATIEGLDQVAPRTRDTRVVDASGPGRGARRSSCTASAVIAPGKPSASRVIPGGAASTTVAPAKPTRVRGRAWVIPQDNIDTDMIFHNKHLTVTDVREMGQYALGNLRGWENFAKRARPGDIVVVGKNFGCGSSRQQAVDCFLSLGIAAIVAESFGAIYERNAINAGLAIITAPWRSSSSTERAGPVAVASIADGDDIEVDFTAGTIRCAGGAVVNGTPMAAAQLAIYQRGGLLANPQ